MSKWKKVLKGHCGTEKIEEEESEKKPKDLMTKVKKT